MLGAENDAEALFKEAAKLRAEIGALTTEEKAEYHVDIEGLEARLKSGVNAAVLDSAKREWQDMRWKSATFDYEKGSSWTEARLRALTKIRGEDLLGMNSEQVSTQDLTTLTAVVFVLSGIGAIVSNLLLQGNLGAFASYIFAIVPIIFLAIGSSAPQLITDILTSTDDQSKAQQRRICHESAHLVAGYAIGLEIKDFSAGVAAPRVEFNDESMGNTNQRRPRSQVESLAVVALAGAVAEAKRFGSAKGAIEDLRTLQQLVNIADPPYKSNEEQQQLARRAAVRAAYLLDLDNLAARPADVGTFPSLGRSVLAAVEDAMVNPETDLPTIITVLEKAAAAAAL
uniref:Uncharacterized protein n=1 Tax=Aureoumbra lagunensis TaxID=44058 RepID=A0A7S3K645_9STRA